MAAAGVSGYALAGGIGVLLVATPLFGIASGAGTTGRLHGGGPRHSGGRSWDGFGVLNSGSLVGLALSLVCGSLAATSIRAVFELDIVALLAVSAVVSRLMLPERLEAAAAPATEEL